MALALLALYPLAGSELQRGHDAESYVPRVVEFHEAIGRAHVPPVWAAHVSRGHGQPLFEFAPPLLYALGEPIYAVGGGIARAVQIPVLILFVLGAMALGDLVARLVDPSKAKLVRAVAASALLFAPYAQVELYVRAAHAEAAAMALLPVVLLATHTVLLRPTSRAVAILAIAAALLPCAHFPMALMGLAAAAVFALVLTAASSTPSGRLGAVGIGMTLGLGLSAFAWLPAWFERGLIHSARLAGAGLDYRDHFVTLGQLAWTTWGFGYSVSGQADAMPLHLGPTLLLVAMIGLWSARSSPERRPLAIACAAIGLTTAMMATSLSAPIWERVAALHYFGYPWRFHAVTTVVLAILAGLAAASASRAAGVVLVGVLVVPNIGHVGAWGSRVVEPHESVPESIASRAVKTTLLAEYEPLTAEPGLPYSPRHLEVRPMAAIEPLLLSPHRRVFDVTSTGRATVTSRTFHYPGWEVRVDGVAVAAGPERGTGRITFEIEAGRHRVEIVLRSTPVRRAGAMISLVSAFVVAGAMLVRRHNPGETEPGR